MGVALVLGVGHEHREVIEPVLQALDEVGRHRAVQVEADVGIALAEGPHALGDEAHARALAGADVDVARHDVVVMREVRRGLVCQPHDLLGAASQVEALLGWTHAAAAALEQLASELALEAGDLARERRLRDVQLLGGARHGPALADGEVVAKGPELHGLPQTA